MKLINRLFTMLIAGSTLAVACAPEKQNSESETNEITTADNSTYYLGINVDSIDIADHTIKRNETFGAILNRLKVSPSRADSIIKAAAPVFDISRIVVGRRYSILTSNMTGMTEYLVYEKNKRDHIIFDMRDSINVYEYNKEIFTRQGQASGTINSSLWKAIRDGGNDIRLSDKMAEIFAWQIDFFGIGRGDNFRILYDQDFIDDSISIDISNIRGAVFNHLGKDYYAIPFAQDSVVEYFDENGKSLRKAFLKAPLKYSRISSTFSNARKHPVLKIVRPHHGVDYAAPVGTPVRSIGDGTVVKKAYQSGGAGYYLKVRHNSSYETTYMHLSKFAKGIKEGQRVAQGEVIGYVGSSGSSTGPHLDFRVHFQGKPINPLKMESPSVEPVRPELADSFNIVKQQIIDQLKAIPMAQSQEGK